MEKTSLNTENRIRKAAKEIFLRYGFHGSRLQQIAEIAEVNKSIIHYYFRSKKGLYMMILIDIIKMISKSTEWLNKTDRK